MRFQNIIFPSITYIFRTKLTRVEVKKRILEKIKESKKFSQSEFDNHLTRKYDGILINETFKISQIIVGKRNSFAPLIIGHITTQDNDTIIEINMEIQSFAKIFTILWLCIVGFICFIIILVYILNFIKNSQIKISPFLLIPFGMFLLGCFIPLHGFKIESNNSKNFLINLLEGDILN